jgi:hypothetical protein
LQIETTTTQARQDSIPPAQKKAVVLIVLPLAMIGTFLVTKPDFSALAEQDPAAAVPVAGVKRVELALNIDDASFTRLKEWRRQAIARRTLYEVEQEWLNATIAQDGGEPVPVKVRLKGGGAVDHLGGDKWSLRVSVRGDNAILGMTGFSLMDPRRRSLMYEWFVRKLASREGIMAKRYVFVELRINGEAKGTFAADEHYTTQMIEHNRRREGPIIRLIQDHAWREKAAWYTVDSQRDDYYYATDVDAINSSAQLNDDAKAAVFHKARITFEAFRNGDLTASDAFDIDLTARWMALGDVLGAWHGFGVFNMKWYYNPVTSRFEPIPDDNYNEKSHPAERLFRINDPLTKGKFLRQLFDDLAFTERYLRDLERFSQQSFLDEAFAELDGEIVATTSLLTRDYPGYALPKEVLYQNQQAMQRILNPSRGIAAYYDGLVGENVVVRVANVKTMPMEILELGYRGRVSFKPAKDRAILPGHEYASPLNYTDVPFFVPSEHREGISRSNLTVTYRILGTSMVRTEPVYPWPAYDNTLVEMDATRTETDLTAIPFLDVDQDRHTIEVKQGNWTLSEPLTIPAGYKFVVAAGTSLDLTNGAMLLSYSPVFMIGTEQAPITLHSSDSKGQGLVVINAAEESFLYNVVFKNMGAPASKEWNLTGSVTFYDSRVYVKNSRFLSNRSEDSLNIVRSTFIVEGSLFEKSHSDALDVDFGKGKILDTTFLASRNDAIDASGSAISIKRCVVYDAGDKGVSAGEGSTLNIDTLEIRGGTSGVVAKDLSIVNAINVRMKGPKIAWAAYQKKPEFGPGRIKAINVTVEGATHPHKIERGSHLLENGNSVVGREERVAAWIARNL